MMKDGQFKQFAAEVLQQGTDAVLPQNLPDRWLNALLEEAEIFQEEDSDIEETCAGLLSAVILILSQHSGHPDQMGIPVTTLLRCMSYYVMTLAGESVSRHTDMWVEPPTLENIFHEDREMKAMPKSALN